MADTNSRTTKRHTRRQESISKCRSLPSLQLTPSDGSADFVCQKCGLTNSLIPICLWCYQTSTLDEDQRPLGKRVSWSIISAVTTQENQYGSAMTDELPPTLSPPSITSQKTSEASCEPQVQEVTGQFNKGDASHGQGLHQTDGVEVTSGRLNTDLHNDRIKSRAPSPPLSTPARPALEKLLKARFGSHIRHFQRDDAFGSPYREDNSSSLPVAMSHSTASCVSSAQVPAHGAVSSNLGAGTSYVSPNSTQSSSSSRRLRSRSKSLFSLSIASAVGPPSSTHSDTNTPTIINNNQPTSTTTNMINAAKALSRRISSTTLRVMEPSAAHVSIIPDLKHHDLSPIPDSQVPADEKHSRFDCEENRTLRRKKRLGVAASPPSRPSPAASINSNTLKKQVSVASLKGSKPISVSFKLGKRPGTSESEGSTAGNHVTNEESLALHSSGVNPKENASVDEGIDSTSVEGPDTTDMVMLPPPLNTDLNRIGSSQQAPIYASNPESPSRPPSQTVTPVPVATPLNNARIGHPSRPYYSAIRKHHMSAPPKPTSPPQSAEVSPANSRPVSSSVAHHPPSAFAMQIPVVASFARRPVSLGAVPSAGSSSQMTHAHTHSIGSAATKGMSVFDLEDETYPEVFEDDDAPTWTAPSSYRSKNGKKSHSLSKAFVRGHKRRTWSSGLFSGEEEAVRSANYAAKSANHGRRLSHGVPPPPPLSLDRIGVSMSGETELRMTLAMMEENERAQQQQQQQLADSECSSATQLPSASSLLPTTQSEQRFRFRHTADFSQQQRSESQTPLGDYAGPSRTGTPSGSGSAGVMARVRKFKKSFIKGLQVLGSTSATHQAS